MACNLYVYRDGEYSRLGQFSDRQKAEDFFRIWVRSQIRPGSSCPKAVYVETGKGRGKR